MRKRSSPNRRSSPAAGLAPSWRLGLAGSLVATVLAVFGGPARAAEAKMADGQRVAALVEKYDEAGGLTICLTSGERKQVALRDVESIASYLVSEGSGRADQIVERIITRGESLDTVPERGRTPPELRAINDRTWREVQEPSWRLLYRISGKTVEIHGVLDSRRSLEDILMERLLQL